MPNIAFYLIIIPLPSNLLYSKDLRIKLVFIGTVIFVHLPLQLVIQEINLTKKLKRHK